MCAYLLNCVCEFRIYVTGTIPTDISPIRMLCTRPVQLTIHFILLDNLKTSTRMSSPNGDIISTCIIYLHINIQIHLIVNAVRRKVTMLKKAMSLDF